jgi:hypothetical protein
MMILKNVLTSLEAEVDRSQLGAGLGGGGCLGGGGKSSAQLGILCCCCRWPLPLPLDKNPLLFFRLW